MNDQQTQLLQAILAELKQLNAAVKGRQPAPNYQYPLHRYTDFDWSSIGAEVTERDRNGDAVAVNWQGRTYTRRSPQNRFDPAIWYSRLLDSEGDKARYERLVTFKDFEVEPLPGKVADALQSHPRQQQQQSSQPRQPATASKGTITREEWQRRQKQRQQGAG